MIKEKVKSLFGDWQETIIWSCLQEIMGNVYVDEEEEPKSAMAVLGDFGFLAGEPKTELLEHLHFWREEKFIILVPQSDAWAKQIEAYYGNKAKKIKRYAFKKERDVFDRDKLRVMASAIPKGYTLHMIDEELFAMCKEESWSQDLVSQFLDYKTYEKLGIGVVICKDGIIAAGASSYSRYQEGIEIEIDTKKEYQRQGLATVCGARLILECLERGLYPSWDAHNVVSATLAKKFGYHLSHVYIAYEIWE